MAQRHQQGWLKREKLSRGETWVLFFRTVRKSDDEGRQVDDDPRRFGFHNLRHSLASFLVRIGTDPKTVHTLLRHSDVKLTLQCYTHSVSEDRMAAAGAMLTAIFSHAADRSGLKAD
jgi:integrase